MDDSIYSSPVVRPAESRDVLALAALIQSVWEDAETDFLCLNGESRLQASDLPSFLDDLQNVTLVHESSDDGSCAAALSGVIFLTRIAPTIYDLGIVASPQGSGIGSLLLDAAIDLSRCDGMITEIYLDVFLRNPAIHLYERKGFQEYDRIVSTNQRAEELELCRMRLLIRKFSGGASTAVRSDRWPWLRSILMSIERGFSVIRKFAAFK